MKHKKKNKFFKGLFVFLFLVYMTIYISESSGYYEFKNYKKATLTKEKIAEFEQDIKKGKSVSLDKYIDNYDTNYSNKISNVGYNLSKGVSDLVNKGVTNFFNTIASLAKE